MLNLLLLEDDLILASEIVAFLSRNGMACEAVYDGDLFLRQFKRKSYDGFLMDINVPKINGIDLCKKIREQDILTPILMLTAFGEIEDKKDAFEAGADDYLVKPFHLEELLIRINALQRRKLTPQQSTNLIVIEDLSIDLDSKTVIRQDEVIDLTPKEFKLLTILANAKGRVLSKQDIAEQLWDYQIETNHNTIEVYVSFLRNKIDKSHTNKLLHTKVGFGYYLKNSL